MEVLTTCTYYEEHKSSIFSLDANIISASLYIIPIFLLLIPNICYIIWVYPLTIYLLEKRSYYVKIHSLLSCKIQFIYTLINIISLLLLKLIIAKTLKLPYPLYIIKAIAVFSGPIIFIFTVIFITLSLICIDSAFSYEIHDKKKLYYKK